MHPRVRTVAAVTIGTLALLAAGCGTRVKTETTASDGGLGSPQNVASPGGTTVGGAAEAGGPSLFGTIESPCGQNTTGAPLPASATGVTADSITISTISDPGGPKIGLNQGVFDSMVAFTDWCNAQGGVNGRKLVLEQRDAKIFDYKNQVLAACQDSFALVGGIGVVDDQGVDDAEACGLVNLPAAAVGAKASTAVRTYQPLPFDPDKYPTGSAQWVKKNHPDVVAHAGSFYSSLPLVDYQNQRWVEGYKEVGFDFKERTASSVNEPNWGPLVVQMQNAGVKYLTLTSSFEEVIPLQKEMNLQGYKPDVFELETSFYDQKYPDQAAQQGVDTSNTYVRLTVWPFEEADTNAAMRSFLDAMEQSLPETQPTELGVQAFSAGLLFATAAKKAGPNLTQDALIAALKEIHAWDAGGLHGPADVGAKQPAICFIMLKVADGKFSRVYPMPDTDKAVYENKLRPGMACPEDALVTYSNPPKAAG
jgi:ABC-type branched-subunit amino acid transport system substrate-binding protein